MYETAPFERPSDLDWVRHPLNTSPDGRFGYIQIHKCGTNTYAIHLRHRLLWNLTYSDPRLASREQYTHNPDPEKILVIVRDPVDRYLSAMIQVGKSRYDPWVAQNIINHADQLYTKQRNQHAWPFSWFLSEWMQFYHRMEFVDIKDVPSWFVENGVDLPPKEEAHRNKSPDGEKARLWEHIDDPDHNVLYRIRTYYANDYKMLAANGLEYDGTR